MLSHVVHNFRLLTDYEEQVRRSSVPYAEHNAGGFQEIINEFVQLPMWLSGMITVQKDDHRQWLRIFLVGIPDDEANQVAESLFPSLIGGGPTSFEWDRLESFTQFLNSFIVVFGRLQIEVAVTIVAPVG